MERKSHCTACTMMRNGVKTRKALRHTCGLPDGAIPPDVLESRQRLSLDTEPENHEWVEGDKWIPEATFYSTREDTCSKCGCKRQMIKHYISKGKYDIYPVTYERSQQIFGEEHVPECWGSKNP